MSRTQRLLLFAIPDATARTEVESRISELANAHGGPRFDAHMTLYAGDYERESDLLDRVRAIAASTTSFSHPVVGVTSGTLPHKCVFVQLEPGGVASAIAEQARDVAATKDYELDPHVSLLYGEYPDGIPAAIASTVSWTLSHVRFSELAVMAKGVGTGAPVDVAAWRPILRLPLASGRVTSGRTS